MPEAAQIALRAEPSHQHNTTTSTSRVTSVGYYRISFMDQGLDRRSSYIKTRAPNRSDDGRQLFGPEYCWDDGFTPSRGVTGVSTALTCEWIYVEAQAYNTKQR
jgi:hypothetical protein